MGYTIFADILKLESDDRWSSIPTATLQTRAIKMLPVMDAKERAAVAAALPILELSLSGEDSLPLRK